MKKRNTHRAEALTLKREVIPIIFDTIKTEEITLKELPSECDIADIPIKQEESNLEVKNHDSAFDNQSDPSDPNFYCESCNKKYASHNSFRKHILYVHKAVKLSQRSKPNYSVEPDPDNSNYYCKSCSIKYPMRYIYRIHLRQVHKMFFLEPLIKRKPKSKPKAKPNHSIKPDPEDPNYYCKSCYIKYPMRYIYRVHLRQVHKMILEPLKKQPPKPNHSIKPDPEDPNFYCKSCTIKYPIRYIYRRHLRNVHKIALEPLYKKRRVASQP